jgi:peptidoglycan lytic transglycosylase G
MGLFKGIRSIVKIFFLALITVIALGIFIKLDYSKALETPNSQDTTKISLEITQGETTDDILSSLVESGLLKEKWLNYAKIYLILEDLSSSLQAGTYHLPKNLSILEIIDTLQNGRDPDNWVTIPEGLRKDTMADLIAEEIPSFSKDTFLALTTDQTFIDTLDMPVELQDLEGYLFPDTYAFAPEATEEDIIKRIIENFKTIVGTEDSYEDINFASIVEREGFDNEDRPTIAGILIKRYNEGWKLGSSVTVLYYFKTWKEETLTSEDLADTSNPYNTYALVGLPPTPICNPGLESIEAMRNPIETDYYYFIRGKDTDEKAGETHYGVTYEDHQENINNYLR